MSTAKSNSALAAGIAAGIGASLCCVVPLLFVAVGLGGSWLSTLTALEPYRPIFVLLALAAMGYAYWQIFHREPACAEGEPCATPATQRRRKILFGVAVAMVALFLLSPYIISGVYS